MKTLILTTIVSLSFAHAADKPNIIVIYSDDQGWGDMSAWNKESKFETPYLDTLAHEGISFKHGHSAASVCAPSRYGILTGRYPWRTRVKMGNCEVDGPCLIKKGETTLASLLQSHGYNTGMVGKWHLGMEVPGKLGCRDWTQPLLDNPLDKGFDYFYGIPGSMNYGIMAWFEGRFAKVPPTQYTNKKQNERHKADYRMMPPYEDSPGISDDSTRLIKENIEVAEDFVDNMALTRFTEKAIEWMKSKEQDAKNGKPFFLYLPYTSPHYPVCPLPAFHGKGKAGAYGEFMIETDHHVGSILKYLKQSGLDENTMVIYTSDNGPENSWKKRISDFQHDSRGGLRGGKRSAYEGGHRVPFIVRWPAGITQPGRDWNKPVSQTDILATFADLCGSPLKSNEGPDSQSFFKVLKDPAHDYLRVPLLCTENNIKHGRYGITEGEWKFVISNKGRKELFNLTNDLAEEKNLAKKHPQKVADLLSKLKKIVAQGRSTPGEVYRNDTGYWEGLKWFPKAEYESLAQ